MPVLSDSVPPSAHTSPGSSSSRQTQNKYIFGSLALVFILLFVLQKRLEKRKRSKKYAQQYSHHEPNKSASHPRNFTNLSSRSARMSFPSALPEKQYSASGPPTTGPLQGNDYAPASISSTMRPTSSSSQHNTEYTFPEEKQARNLTPTPPSSSPHYSSPSSFNYPGVGADTAILQGQGQGQGHEDPSTTTPSSQAKNPPPPSKSRILRPPQTTPPPISAPSKSWNLSANAHNLNTSSPHNTITATASRRSSSGTTSSLIHPDLPDPSIVSLNTSPSGAASSRGLSIYTNTNTEFGLQQGQAPFEPQYPITFVPSPTEYTSFEALYSQNPPYYEASSEDPFPSSDNPELPRRRSYTKSLSNGSEVSGEIIVSSSGIEGQGWRRHTRVFGGGVCRACEESKGSFLDVRRSSS